MQRWQGYEGLAHDWLVLATLKDGWRPESRPAETRDVQGALQKEVVEQLSVSLLPWKPEWDRVISRDCQGC